MIIWSDFPQSRLLIITWYEYSNVRSSHDKAFITLVPLINGYFGQIALIYGHPNYKARISLALSVNGYLVKMLVYKVLQLVRSMAAFPLDSAPAVQDAV